MPKQGEWENNTSWYLDWTHFQTFGGAGGHFGQSHYWLDQRATAYLNIPWIIREIYLGPGYGDADGNGPL